MLAPVWNIRLTCALVRGLKEAMFPLYMNVGLFHLIVSVMRSSERMMLRTFCIASCIGWS